MPWKWERFFELIQERVPAALVQHLYITALTALVSCAIGLSVAVALTRPRLRRAGPAVMAAINLLQTVPSLVLLVFVMPFLGLGLKPALLALVVISTMPIAKNGIAGIDGVPESVREAARGMGMPAARVLIEVEIPLAMPVILAGVRTSVVTAVASGTLASTIGAGGLGDLIFLGLLMNWHEALVIGAGLAALMATALDASLNRLSLRFVPPGMTVLGDE
jgi:osmoprotectant transport system permease protein